MQNFKHRWSTVLKSALPHHQTRQHHGNALDTWAVVSVGIPSSDDYTVRWKAAVNGIMLPGDFQLQRTARRKCEEQSRADFIAANKAKYAAKYAKS